MVDVTAEQITILIGVIALIVGVVDSRKSHRQAIKAQNLQIILNISESFRNKWESEWGDVLEGLGANPHGPLASELSVECVKSIRYMLNWIDWLGAMKSSESLEDLDILTSSIGPPMVTIINAGHQILVSDCEEHGSSYWKNLLVVAEHLNIDWAIELKNKCAAK